ncbi:MAG: hypothetical protein PF569_05045 [Candidatus Woesearchaeota archaeon]|jgi:hypothetical protein|nr:hypothetical protein [Candidatus Woesearchaeota archaeon]
MEYIYLPLDSVKENKIYVDLLREKFKFGFLPPTFSRVPNVSSLFKDNKYSFDCFGRLESYLLDTQVIFMRTNNASKQKEIKDQIAKAGNDLSIYDWFISHNKLAIGKFSIISDSLYILEQTLNRDDIRKTIDIQKISQGYHSLEFKEKVERVEFADKEVFNFLEQMYKEYS